MRRRKCTWPDASPATIVHPSDVFGPGDLCFQSATTIRYNPKTKQRRLDALRWGLIPYWAKDEKIAYRTINARVETVDTAPSYREAFKKRRCLIPADSFYEWKKLVGGKIPYAIGMKDDSPFVFAGLWEGWKDPATGEWLRYVDCKSMCSTDMKHLN
jgi:putative SOS response-associated peptidase YedK